MDEAERRRVRAERFAREALNPQAAQRKVFAHPSQVVFSNADTAVPKFMERQRRSNGGAGHSTNSASSSGSSRNSNRQHKAHGQSHGHSKPRGRSGSGNTGSSRAGATGASPGASGRRGGSPVVSSNTTGLSLQEAKVAFDSIHRFAARLVDIQKATVEVNKLTQGLKAKIPTLFAEFVPALKTANKLRTALEHNLMEGHIGSGADAKMAAKSLEDASKALAAFFDAVGAGHRSVAISGGGSAAARTRTNSGLARGASGSGVSMDQASAAGPGEPRRPRSRTNSAARSRSTKHDGANTSSKQRFVAGGTAAGSVTPAPAPAPAPAKAPAPAPAPGPSKKLTASASAWVPPSPSAAPYNTPIQTGGHYSNQAWPAYAPGFHQPVYGMMHPRGPPYNAAPSRPQARGVPSRGQSQGYVPRSQ